MYKAIYFDMDGTIADLYGVENWLDCLIAGQTKPYREAKPLVNMRQLAKLLNTLQAQGWKIGVISWLSKSGSDEYGDRVAKTKEKWLAKHKSKLLSMERRNSFLLTILSASCSMMNSRTVMRGSVKPTMSTTSCRF